MTAEGDVGGRLRRAREERGLSLRETAQRTKLSIYVLEAIERNDFASLPGGMFRRAYVRTLAAELGLDPDAVAAEYSARFEPPIVQPSEPARQTELQAQLVEQLTPSPRRSIASLAVLVALAVGWFMLQRDRDRPTVPEGGAAGIVAVRVPAGSESLSTEPVVHAGAASASAGESNNVPLFIEISAAGWCWIAAETDGERVLYRLVEPGERVTLEGERAIRLRLGDAGAVALSINGGPRRSLGKNGEVVELEVTADNLEALRDGGVETVSETGV